jgi:hypothetical protein
MWFVELRWNGRRGFDDAGLLVATVAEYDDPDGIASVPGAIGSYWLAFVRQERVPGAWATEAEAQAAAEAQLGAE